MVFNSTFNNISVISWRSALLVETVADPIIKWGCVEIQLTYLTPSILMLVPIHNFDGQRQMSWYFWIR